MQFWSTIASSATNLLERATDGGSAGDEEDDDMALGGEGTLEGEVTQGASNTLPGSLNDDESYESQEFSGSRRARAAQFVKSGLGMLSSSFAGVSAAVQKVAPGALSQVRQLAKSAINTAIDSGDGDDENGFEEGDGWGAEEILSGGDAELEGALLAGGDIAPSHAFISGAPESAGDGWGDVPLDASKEKSPLSGNDSGNGGGGMASTQHHHSSSSPLRASVRGGGPPTTSSEKEIRSLRAELSSAQELAGNERSRAEALRAHVITLDKKLATMAGERDELEATYHEKLSSLEKEWKRSSIEANGEGARVRAELDDERSKREDAEAQVMSKSVQLAETREMYKKALEAAHLKALAEGTLSPSEDPLSGGAVFSSQSSSKFLALEAQLREAKAQLEETRGECESLRARLEAAAEAPPPPLTSSLTQNQLAAALASALEELRMAQSAASEKDNLCATLELELSTTRASLVAANDRAKAASEEESQRRAALQSSTEEAVASTQRLLSKMEVELEQANKALSSRDEELESLSATLDSVSSSLADRDTEIVQLRASLGTLSGEGDAALQASRAEVEKLRSSLKASQKGEAETKKSAKKAAGEAAGRLESAEAARVAAEAASRAANEELVLAMKKCSHAVNEGEKYSTLAATREKELEELKATLARLKGSDKSSKAVKAAEAASAASRKELEDAQQTHARVSAGLQAQVDGLGAALSEEREKYRRELEAALGSARDAAITQGKIDLEGLKAEHAAECAALREEWEKERAIAANALAAARTEALSAAGAVEEGLRTALASAMAKVEMLEKSYSTLQENLRNANLEAREARAAAESALASAGESSATAAAAATREKAALADASTARKECQSLRKKLETIEAAHASATRSHMDLEADVVAAESRAAEAEAARVALESAMAAAAESGRSERELLISSLAAAEGRLGAASEVEDSLLSLKAELAAKEADLSSAQTALGALEGMLEGLQASVLAAEARSVSAEEETSRLTSQISNLEEQIVLLRGRESAAATAAPPSVDTEETAAMDAAAVTSSAPPPSPSTSNRLAQAQVKVSQLQQTIHELRAALNDARASTLRGDSVGVDRILLGRLLVSFCKAAQDVAVGGVPDWLESSKSRDALAVMASILGLSGEEREACGLVTSGRGTGVGGLLSSFFGGGPTTPATKGGGGRSTMDAPSSPSTALADAFVQFLLEETVEEGEEEGGRAGRPTDGDKP